MFAVIKTGGKQYIVAPGKKLKVEKLAGNAGEAVAFDKVLAVFDENSADFGAPTLEKAKVEGIVIKQGRARKITNLRYHSKTRYRKKKGHRQYFTEVEIKEIKK